MRPGLCNPLTFAFAAAAACSIAAGAHAADLFPTSDSRAQDAVMQDARPGEYYYNLAAEAVRKKDYSHAVDMYQVSASWAYKTSEYNLGVMYARGEGVAVDMPRAMAWMTLAAERGDTPQYVQARDLVASQLDKDGLAKAEALLTDMLPMYGDAVALNRAKTKWREARNSATGSHVGFVGTLEVGEDNRRFMALPSSNGVPNFKATAARATTDLVGGQSEPGSNVYSDLHVTDNPYDPKLQRGVASVGPLRAADAHEKVEPASSAAPASEPARQ